MECNKDESLRGKEIAETKFKMEDIAGAKKFALKAQSLYPDIEGVSQVVATFDVYIAAEEKVNNEEVNYYAILNASPCDDTETLKRKYRELALMLHPDKNSSVGADGAFKHISEAWKFLSDKEKREAYDLSCFCNFTKPSFTSNVRPPPTQKNHPSPTQKSNPPQPQKNTNHNSQQTPWRQGRNPRPRYQPQQETAAQGSQGKKKPVFVKVDQLKPGTRDHTLSVKVVDQNFVGQKAGTASSHLRPARIAECLVGDETASILFTARNDQVDLMKPGTTVNLRNAKIDMFKGFMRLAVGKWGRIEVTDPADITVKGDNNLSLVEYELVFVKRHN